MPFGNTFIDFSSVIHIKSWMLWLVLFLFVVGYVVISGILLYHWRKYGLKHHAIVLAEFIYFLVSALFIYSAIIGIIIY